MDVFKVLMGEFLGTMILIIIGNGVCYSVSHHKMFANQPGKWVVIALAWGIAVFMGATVASALDAPGHLNPAVSIFDAIKSKEPMHLANIPLQMLGAMTGQLVLNFINWKFIIATAEIDHAATRGAHATGPAFSNKEDKSTIFNFAYELVGTAVLLTMILVLGLGGNKDNFPKLGAMPVSIVIVGLGMALGSATGYALNPARDLGPRIVYQIMKPLIEKKSNVKLADANWAYSWVPVFAPIAAGLIIGPLALLA